MSFKIQWSWIASSCSGRMVPCRPSPSKKTMACLFVVNAWTRSLYGYAAAAERMRARSASFGSGSRCSSLRAYRDLNFKNKVSLLNIS